MNPRSAWNETIPRLLSGSAKHPDGQRNMDRLHLYFSAMPFENLLADGDDDNVFDDALLQTSLVDGWQYTICTIPREPGLRHDAVCNSQFMRSLHECARKKHPQKSYRPYIDYKGSAIPWGVTPT